jgi:hypothetical protein
MKQRLRVMDRPGPDTGWPDRVYAISTSLHPNLPRATRRLRPGQLRRPKRRLNLLTDAGFVHARIALGTGKTWC